MTIAVAASTSYSPGLRQASVLQKAVLSYVQAPQDDDELNEHARNALNDAVDAINTRTWKKLHGHQDILLAADQWDYELASSFKDPLNCARINTNGDQNGRLEYKPLKTFLVEHDQATGSGMPRWYTIFYDQLRVLSLDLAPSSEYISSFPTLRLRYHRRVPHLTGPDSILGIPSEFESFVVWHAKAYIAADRAPQMVGYAENKAQQTFKRLKVDDANIQTDWDAVN